MAPLVGRGRQFPGMPGCSEIHPEVATFEPQKSQLSQNLQKIENPNLYNQKMYQPGN